MKLKFDLWKDRVSTKKSIGTSHFQLVYGIDIVSPTYLGIHVLKILKKREEEPNSMQNIINNLIEL